MTLSERIGKANVLTNTGRWAGTYEVTGEELIELAQLEEENTALKRENEALREYIPEHILKEWEYYRALLADTQDTENNKCAEPTDNAEVLHTKESE